MLAAVVVLIVGRARGDTHGGADAAADAPTANSGGAPQVAVKRQTVAEVLTIDSRVVASPRFAVTAVSTEPVRRAPHTEAGSNLSAGVALFYQGTSVIRTPIAATVVSWQLPVGATAVDHLPIVVLRYNGFGMTAALAAADGYRILSRDVSGAADIVDGPGPFDCPLLTPASGSPDTALSDSGSGTVVLCAIPSAVTAFVGLAGQVAITSGLANDALVLPTYAVLGSAQSGEVYKVASNGRATIIKVGLGLTNGGTVQITSGLSLGDRVLANPPTLDETNR